MGLDMSINDAAHQEIRYGSILDCEIVYWRKANAVHRWFCYTLPSGVGNCEHVPITGDHCAQLLHRCWRISEDPSLAGELLPTQSGFFFGGTEYDTWYYDQVESTIKQLLHLFDYVNKTPSCELYYEASW